MVERIEQGEELCTSYLDLYKVRADRQQACTLTGKDRDASDASRQRLWRLSQELEASPEEKLADMVEAGFEAAAQLGDLPLAEDMAQRALDQVLLVEGPSPRAQMLQQCVELFGGCYGIAQPRCKERKYPQRYSGDYFRDTLPSDLYELEQAVVDGDVFTVRKLLQAGVNLNAPLDSNHMTALMIACMMGNWDLIQLLVEDFDADLDGPLSRAGLRAIDYAGYEGFRFPSEHPICEYLKSKGSQHTWWGACCAGDFNRVKEYVDNGQDVDEINPVLWNGNGVFIAKEFGHNSIAQYLLTKGATVVIRNCHTIDTHEMKWSIGRGDAFFYKAGAEVGRGWSVVGWLLEVGPVVSWLDGY
ncbi:unnamed protein product [Effrenium voratum]|uniref:Ankyrin repeat protein n=1 Tax=Effrenium voratum TaxID=2562239 RepID=A0AA36HLK0_9DINO|nr:unnamed protein product [Effrenium voratum]